LGKPWKYLWVLFHSKAFTSLQFNTLGTHTYEITTYFIQQCFFSWRIFATWQNFFFKCQKMSVFWVFCLSNFKILRKLHTILHQVPVGHQRYRRMLQILYFHIFIAKFG
jgi:hypothetical protein